jgi:hypothetical protein
LFWTWRSRRRLGRHGVPADVRQLIRAMAEANPLWGAPRIHGEPLKLGIGVSQTTVAKYMPRHRRPPSQTWRTFLANHLNQIAAADVFVVPTVTCPDWHSSRPSRTQRHEEPDGELRRNNDPAIPPVASPGRCRRLQDQSGWRMELSIATTVIVGGQRTTAATRATLSLPWIAGRCRCPFLVNPHSRPTWSTCLS